MSAGRCLTITTTLLLSGCLGTMGPEEEDEASYSAFASPQVQAVCKAQVNGTGTVDVETLYLARVISCEHGSAPPEALKAQAVAARTYLYYKIGKYGAIGDGQGSQVYTCKRPLLQKHKDAVKATSGQVMLYGGKPICAFYVAGSKPSSAGCVGSAGASSTEKYVTYNKGRSGNNIQQSTIGWISASNKANRGCMSQLGSSCLDAAGYTYADILRFYYGADIQIVTAQGPCVGGGSPPPGTKPAPPTPPPPPPPPAKLKSKCVSYNWISTCQNSKDLLSCHLSGQSATIINCPHGCKLMPLGTSDQCKPGPAPAPPPPPPPAPGSWSCKKSSYKGQQLWTCSGKTLHRCFGGKPAQKSCPAGCKSNPLGTDDVCLGSQPPPPPKVNWSCKKSSYKGQQLWTCSGGTLYRCFGTTPSQKHCPAGCNYNALGQNDTCK